MRFARRERDTDFLRLHVGDAPEAEDTGLLDGASEETEPESPTLITVGCDGSALAVADVTVSTDDAGV